MARLTPEQIAARRHGMGSTDIVEALGLSPWEDASPMRIFLEKRGKPAPRAATPEQDWGHDLEPTIACWYQGLTKHCLMLGGTVHSVEHPWMFATLDYKVAGADKILEIKNVGPAHVRDWDAQLEGGIPDYVRAQVTIAMHCAQVSTCDVVAQLCGRPPDVWTVGFDAALFEQLRIAAYAFWSGVQDGVPPPFDDTDHTVRYLRDKYPAPVRKDYVEVDEGDEIDKLGKERMAVHAKAEDAFSRAKVLSATILDKLGDRYGFKGDGWRVMRGEWGHRFMGK